MKGVAAAALLSAAMLVQMPSASAQDAPAITPALASALDTSLGKFVTAPAAQTPSLSVAIVEHGRVAYAHAFGASDLAKQTQATPQTRYRIASITKMFTAVAIMQLVEQHKIDLDATVATYLPMAPHASEITIRQLLQHTSGLWNYGDQAIADGSASKPTTPQALLASVAARPLDRAPGTAFAYSNTGYVVLGLVVEAVSGMPLAAYERAHIFVPAGLTETDFSDAGVLATGYANATGTVVPAYEPSWFYADGDIISTAVDLARFDIALTSGQLLRPQTFALMQSSSVDASSMQPGLRWGLGVSIYNDHGITAIGHHGGVPGFAAENEILLGHDAAFVVLSDSSTFQTGLANRTMLATLLPDALEPTAAASATLTEDPLVTTRLRTLLTSIVAHTLDTRTLTPTMSAALTPSVLAQISSYYAGLGALQTLTLHTKRSVGSYTVYQYGAGFAGGSTIQVTVSFDSDGRVAGLFE